jgi:hypothetical protein
MNSLIQAMAMAAAAAFQITILAACAVSQTDTGEDRANQAAAEFKRLLDLRRDLEEIPFDGAEKEPYKTLLAKNKNDVVYNEPAGQYIVESDRFWELSAKYKDLEIADEIAWQAAENPLAGECEGFLSCYAEWIRRTTGRYLELYPDGKHSSAALKEVSGFLADVSSDLQKKARYSWPEGPEESADLQKTLSEFESILARIQHPDKKAAIADIKKIRQAMK